MLTRLEVDGFKNLLDLRVDFGPFTCIAGENGAGKSNVFDAIHLLALLADHSLMEAAQELRSNVEERSGDPRDLFWNGHTSDRPQMRFAVEMIVPREVNDDFGRHATATITFLRYELEIGYEPPQGLERHGRLVLLGEQLRHINIGDASKRLAFDHATQKFRRHVVVGRRSGRSFISTTGEPGERMITIHADGGSRGQPRPAAATRAPATVVSTVTGADDPTILAARREMQRWQRLALEPSSLRSGDRYTDPKAMTSSGRHLAATLYRIATTPDSAGVVDQEAVYARVASRLASLTGLNLRTLRVDADDSREQFTLFLREASGLELPARSLSEGTLRFLALCVILEDPTVEGLLCMEEPENGIHPANLEAMVDMVRDLAVDPFEPPGPDNPFRQVIVNTHSPAVVQLVKPDDLLYASTAPVRLGERMGGRRLRLRPLSGTWRAERDDEAVAGRADLLAYLTSPIGAQLTLDDSSAA